MLNIHELIGEMVIKKYLLVITQKVKNDFHWSPKINPKKGIKILIDWVIQNKKVISKVLGK